LLKSLVFDFFNYLKTLFLNKSWGFSDFSYPQTVQHFVFAACPSSFYSFLLVFLVILGTLGFFLLLKARKREMKKDFSRLSFFLRMDIKRVRKQALLAALPHQALFWTFFAPLIFLVLLFTEAYFELQGLGMVIKIAYFQNDMPLLYGSIFCSLLFACMLSVCFLFLRSALPHK